MEIRVVRVKFPQGTGSCRINEKLPDTSQSEGPHTGLKYRPNGNVADGITTTPWGQIAERDRDDEATRRC